MARSILAGLSFLLDSSRRTTQSGLEMTAPNTKQLGDETEARIISELVAAGYSVSVPFGDNDKYDLIVDNEGDLYRIQCKTAWANKQNTIRFNTHSQTTKDGAYHEQTYEDEVDCFVVRYPQVQFYILDRHHRGDRTEDGTSVRCRHRPPTNQLGQRVRVRRHNSVLTDSIERRLTDRRLSSAVRSAR